MQAVQGEQPLSCHRDPGPFSPVALLFVKFNSNQQKCKLTQLKQKWGYL